MRDGIDNGHDPEDCDDCEGGPMGVEFETAGQVLLGMRDQNVELIRIAAQIAGYAGTHSPLKPNELRNALSSIWDVYSQLYQWVDPEESIEDDEDDEDDAE